MGAVYRAYDRRLDRRVAIKHVRPDRDGDRSSRARLRREARAAAGLAHPSIIQIFEYVEGEDGEWIVMELIDGPSLADLLQRGPLDVATAVRFAQQVAEGLAFAHGQGIIHRDLKAENVMISPLGQAKILDFGLAKRLARDDNTLTASGVVVGTRRAMSPEQAQGYRVDARSDLFSLGVLLYECLTGTSPFLTSSGVTTLTRVCTHRQKPVRALVPETPRALSKLVDQLLEKLPEARPSGAREVARRLSDLADRIRRDSTLGMSEEGLPGSETVDFGAMPVIGNGADGMPSSPAAGDDRVLPAAMSSSRFWPSRRRLARAAPIAALLLIVVPALVVPDLRNAVAGLLRPVDIELQDSQSRPGAGPAVAGPDPARMAPLRIVVLPFESLGPPTNAYFAAGITEEVSRRLTLISGLGVISRTSAARFADFGVQQIGRELDVEYVLEGTVQWPPEGIPQNSNHKIRITPRLVRVADDLQIWTEPYERELDDFLQVQSEIAAAVATTLDLGLRQTERRAIDARGTEVPAAYHSFLRGLDYLNQPNFSAPGLSNAARMFEHAVRLDPSFAEAHAELSRIYAYLFFNNEMAEKESALSFEALRRASDIDPTHPAVRLASAYYKYHVEEDYTAAALKFESLAQTLPHHPQVIEGLGLVRRRQGRLAEAATLLTQAFSLDPVNASLARNIAGIFRASRDFATTDRWFDKALQLAPDFTSLWGARAVNMMMWKGCTGLGNLGARCSTAEARQVLESCPLGQEDRGLYKAQLALDLYDATLSGSDAPLLRIAERMKRRYRDELSRLDCLTFWHEAVALDRLGRHEQARAFVESCRNISAEVVENRTSASAYWARLGIAEAYLGRRTEALEAAATGVRLGSTDLFRGLQLEEYRLIALLLLGESEQAFRGLDQLLNQTYRDAITPATLWLDPLWASLRSDPRFEQLLKRNNNV